ncbi:hypothetical protein GLOIN_2v1761214 [Rhizophagus clarus]|uniref:Uncharacterized protein n=1 Tax=Rhizophagus clarus TaxID=94130 RepID=A0A8H3KTI5_9GLOM|nr:hypothetical protein GLOIN_2v1761214 [Rhizophagus clarus]
MKIFRIIELETENAEIPDLRRKISEFDAERAEFKHIIAKILQITEEERTRCYTKNAKLRATIKKLRKNNTKENIEFRNRLMKVEEKQILNELKGASHNSSNLSLSNLNLVADQVSTVTQHEKPLVDTSLPENKKIDTFLNEVSNEIRQKDWEKKLQAQKFLPIHPEEKMSQEIKCPTSDPGLYKQTKRVTGKSDSLSSINYNYVTEVSEMTCPEKVIYSIDEASQYLAQLCDKTIDAKDKANQANQEEILCWYFYWKDFRDQLDGIIRSNGGKLKKRRKVCFMTPLQNSFLFFARKDHKNWAKS